MADRQYERQIILKEFGKEGQGRLRRARVLVIGAGGLGCSALQYLAAAGVGTIGIVDPDVVDITNLHRQVLYTFDDIGKPKAETAAAKLRAMNPDAEIVIYPFSLTQHNALEMIGSFDLVIDGSDNFACRYIVNDACVLLDKPLVYGAVWRFEGQVGVFNFSNEKDGYTTSYRDLFPHPPDPSSSPSCSDAGVLGVLPGIIGNLQAVEAIKIAAGIGKPLSNTLLTYNALDNSFCEFHIAKSKISSGPYPKDENSFRNYDYEYFCLRHRNAEISPQEFEKMRIENAVTIIDLCEPKALPENTGIECKRIPLNIFAEEISSETFLNPVILVCQNGFGSLAALKILKEKHPQIEAYSLKGGVSEWKRFHGTDSSC